MKRNKITALLLALVMITAMSQIAAANTYTAQGGTYRFNGSDIVATGSTNVTDQINDLLEPGDSVTIELTYTNDTGDTTEWYMENRVVDVLEAASAKNGGYSYKLSNVGPDGKVTSIFDSDEVGGEKPDGGEVPKEAGTGLEQATNATKGQYASQDYFFIQELGAYQSGKTQLTVTLDPESQPNAYQDKNAVIEFAYAVEKKGTADVYNHITKTVRTGDETKIGLSAAAFLGALLLLILAVRSRRKDRKDGDIA